MTRRLAVLAALAALTACSEESTPAPAPLQVSAAPTVAPANGTSTITVTVSGSVAPPITVTTTRGLFSNGQKSTSIPGNGDVVLSSCNSVLTPACAGQATVSAVDTTFASGRTTVTFVGSEICNNQIDDDGDGLADCADADCVLGTLCGPHGIVCAADRTCTRCGGNGGTAEPLGETTCDDGFDNDCDGQVDCQDPDCNGKVCSNGASGGTCQSNQCVCTKTEPTETTCGDGVDNDCDGLTDCADPNCLNRFCDAVRVCGGTNQCDVCPSGQTNELPTQCKDGRDNDCDNLTDCDDPDCDGQACNDFGGQCALVGSVRICSCTGGQIAETTCDDNVDNDCNGLTDCGDPNCDLQVCGPTSTCEAGKCVDQVTKYAVELTPSRARLPAVANAQSIVTVKVTFEGAAASGRQVSLATGAVLGSVSPAVVTTNGLGEAETTFTATGQVGLATLTATLTGIGTQGTTQIDVPALAEIKLGAVQYPVMGARFSGFQEQNNLSVQLFDPKQQAYPAGLPVLFRHYALGGSFLTPPATPDETGVCEAPWCLGYWAVTDEAGIARVTLYTGTVAGTVLVNASATAGSEPGRTYDLPAIAIIGAKASGSHLSVVCSPENIPALASTTCSVSLVEAPFTCVAVIKDRFNNLLGRQTMVTFMSEGGAVGQPATTPAYDPTQPPTSQPDLGIALEIVNTLGNKLPKDVPPQNGSAVPPIPAGDPQFEYSYLYDDFRCQPGTHNPRDGVVTVVASTPGEEGFFDANGNGVYDLGEPFVDLPEPFVDYNDNNTRDPDEPFVDSNGNGVWDDVNGVWDANAKIWTQTVVVFSGLPEHRVIGGQEYFSRWMTAGGLATFPAPTPPPSPVVPAGTYLDLYSAATDGNFNWLAAGTGYGVYIPGDPSGFDGYLGLKEVSDTKGLSYVYWPCDATDVSKCANDCGAANSPPPARCLMRSVIRGFRYGYTPRTRFSNTSVTGYVSYVWYMDLLGFRETVPVRIQYTP